MKKLVVEILHVDRLSGNWNTKLIRIIEQSHKGMAFNDGQNILMKTCFFHNGFILESGGEDGPSVMKHEEGMIVRGSQQRTDWDIIIMPSLTWLGMMIEAVKAYNLFYGGEEQSIVEVVK